MEKIFAIWIWVFAAVAVMAQPKASQTNQAPDAGQAIQQWMNENIDPDVLQALGQIDQDRVRDFFSQITREFDNTNIYDLATTKAVAQQILPVLKEFEETQPYAAWLEAHLDDLAAAGEMQRQMKVDTSKTNGLAAFRPPPLKIQRAVWARELAKEPWPPLARTYVPKLKPIFVSEKVPAELVWVAGVESSFDPRARSPAGAAGMFQLMPATARTENLSLWPFDERYQPERSARAAAHYLHALHNHYGNWPLALAAYNVGEGRVDKLLKQHRVKTFDGIARWLPAETQMYVPKIEATVRQREGVALASL